MQVLVNMAVVLEVSTIKEAMDKTAPVHDWGVVTGFSANPRPTSVVGPQGPVGATHADLQAAKARLATNLTAKPQPSTPPS